MRWIGFAVLLALAGCGGNYTENADKLATAYYRNTGQPYDCGEKTIESRIFVLCTRNMGDRQDLWLVEGKDIYAVNGGAKGTLPTMGPGFAEYNRQDIDIKTVVESF